MKKIKLFCFLILLSHVLSAQRHDANWPMGIANHPNIGGYRNAILHFDSTGGTSWQSLDLGMNFERTVAAMSDSAGQLLFYTNGCYIAAANGDTLVNGDGLNPGAVHDSLCGSVGYNVPRGALTLPWPGAPDWYVVLHLGNQYSPNEGYRTGPFYYTVVSMANGTQAVTAKNELLWDGPTESFTALRHGNGRDWWIVSAEYGTNLYRVWLFDPNGFSLTRTNSVGLPGTCSRPGILAAAPNGSRLARTQSCRIEVLNFDRCDGSMTEQVRFDRPPQSVNGGGAVFSTDGNTLVYNAHMAILKADLTLPNASLDTLIPVDSLLGVGMYLSERGPNGTLYISRPHRGRAFPLLQGLDDGQWALDKKGWITPVPNVRSLPHLPNYRLYDLPGSFCDTLGINTPVSTQDAWASPEGNWRVFPNPSAGPLHVVATGQVPVARVQVLDALGRVVLEHAPQVPVHQVTLAGETLTAGNYWVRVEGPDAQVVWKKWVFLKTSR